MTHRLPRFLLYPLAAVVPVLGLLVGLGSLAGSAGAATRPAEPAAARAAALAKAAIRQLSIGMHDTNHIVSPAIHHVRGLTQVQSSNWSGYADTGSLFSKVTASWTEPSASCTSRTELLAAFWVGIDGYSSDSVEQDGTLIECYNRHAYQYTWWEMYPTNDIQVVGETLAAGDSISASVARSGTSYTLAVTDSTHTTDSFSTTQTCSNCANTSAEWIAEAPSGSSGVYPLASFGSWAESGSTVTEGSTAGVISSFTDDEITMTDSSGATKALPGALNSAGNAFSVAWERAS